FAVISEINGDLHLVFCSNDGQVSIDENGYETLYRQAFPEKAAIFFSKEWLTATEDLQGVFPAVSKPKDSTLLQVIRIFDSRIWYQTLEGVDVVDLRKGSRMQHYPFLNEKGLITYSYPTTDGLYYMRKND